MIDFGQILGETRRLVNLGRGFWSHMVSIGATWYPDEAKSWSASFLSHYEMNHEQEDTDITFGHVATVEWGLSKTVWKGIDVGFIGYWQEQLTDNTGPIPDTKPRVVGIGPEFNAYCPTIDLTTSVRYVREIEWNSRPRGNLVTLTISRQF